jgi:hypothetical protein
MHHPEGPAVNKTSRTARLVAAAASVAVTFVLLQSVFSLFASASATQLAKAGSAAVVVVAAAR